MTLKEKALKGIKWTALSSVIGAVTQLLQIVVLAHFLAPKDFGLMALATVVIGFSQMFVDMGVSNAIIHKQDITKRELDSLYLLNVISGWIIFVLVFLSAPFIAQFYKEPELSHIIRWVSLTFIIQPFEQQFLALLKKELRFNEIAKRDVMSKLIAFTVSVTLALNGFGVYSLVFANLCAAMVSTFLLVYIGLKYHRPSFYFKFSDITTSVRFGVFQMGDNFINYFNTQFDSILIGKLLGVEILGIYNLAKSLAMRPAQIINPIITQIAFPVMSKIQKDILKLKTAYLKVINYLSSVNFPIYIFIAVFAKSMIMIFFGAKWLEAVPILRILSIYYLVRSTGNPIGALILARGRADLSFYWNLGLFFLIPISIYLGSFFGINGIALTLVGLQLVLEIPGWKLLVNRCCDAGFIEYYKEIAVPLTISCFQGLCCIPIIYLISQPILQIIIGGVVFVITAVILNRLFNKEFYDEVFEYLKFGKLQVFISRK